MLGLASIGRSALLVVAVAGFAVVLLALQDLRARNRSIVAEARFAASRHGTVEYALQGSGPTVLVIHGAGGGFDQGQLLAAAMLGDGFRWLTVSRFGYLGSDLPADTTVRAQAEALCDLLNALNIERVHVLAMSGGVPPALKLAEEYPASVRSLVLLSSAPFTPFGPEVENRPMATWLYAAIMRNDVLYWMLTKVARRALAASFDARPELTVDGSAAEIDFVEELIDAIHPASKRLAGLNNEVAATHKTARYDLESIVAPALVVHAADDRMNPVSISAAIAERIDGAEYLYLDRGGHLLLGHHADLRTRIRAFLADAPRSRD